MPAGPAAKGSAIACRGPSKSFGKIEALHGLPLTVPSGVTFGLLGPNGAGKTTSPRLWLGLTAPTAGKAKVLGESIPPRAVLPRIGYMPQDLAIYLDLTVEENLACFGRLVGMDENAIDRRTAEVLKLVDIAERRGGKGATPRRGGPEARGQRGAAGGHGLHPVRRDAPPPLPRSRPAPRPGPSPARRADCGRRPGAARGVLDLLPRAHGPREDCGHHDALHGGGCKVRPRRPAASGPAPRPGHP